MADHLAVSALITLFGLGFGALAVWPIQITSTFDFWASHAEQLRSSRRALLAWRVFYGVIAALFLVFAGLAASVRR